MTRQWITALASMILISVILVMINALAASVYTLASGGSIIVTLSNILFIEGGIILLLGSAIEFFHLAGSDDRVVISSRILFPVWRITGKEAPEGVVELNNPGWIVIFVGGLLIVYSIVFILIFVK